MGFLNALSEWSAANYQKRVERHRAQGTCPDCRGRGFNNLALTEPMFFNSLDEYKCTSCHGSGLFSAWESR